LNVNVDFETIATFVLMKGKLLLPFNEISFQF